MEDNEVICRVCLADVLPDDKPSAVGLVSPCRCKGTQQYCHLECLRRWQDCVLRMPGGKERAYVCSMCRAPYNIRPRMPPAWSAWMLLARRACSGCGAAAVMTAALALSGPPWPQLALLVIALACARCEVPRAQYGK